MTKHCVLCDKAFVANQDYHIVCGDCFAEGLVDGSEEQMKILRALDTLKGALESDWEMIASSATGPKVAIWILKYMEPLCLRSLLRKVLREL